MKLRTLVWRAALAGLFLAAVGAAPRGADPVAAERQYGVARRLAAEGSPEARRALERVVELDPDGKLADDALLDQAMLERLPDWPESTGLLDTASAARALALLDQLIERFPRGDRVTQARYHRALLRLEPVATYEPSVASVDLTTVATVPSPWAARARYGIAWLHEQNGLHEQAFDAYQRLLVDHSQARAGIRARVGLARLQLRRGEFGSAARWLQEALEADVSPETGAASMRELAVRLLLHQAGAADPSRPERYLTGVRPISGFAPTAEGGVLLGDRKKNRVVEFDAGGTRVGEWQLEDLHTVATDFRGRRFAAAGPSLFRLDDRGVSTPLASLGDLAPVGRLAVDDAGGFWLLDRRGRRLGHIPPGHGGPQGVASERESRLTAMVWDGRGLSAIDGKSRSVLALDHGSDRTLLARSAMKPVALGCDLSGRLAVLDGKAGSVSFIDSNGAAASGPLSVPDGPRAVAVALGPRGELHLFLESGEWVVYR